MVDSVPSETAKPPETWHMM